MPAPRQRAAACIELGAYEEAARALGEALVSAGQMGLEGVRATVLHHQGELRARTGAPEDACRLADGAIAAFVDQGDRRMEAAARVARASFLARADELDGAEAELRTVLDGSGKTAPIEAYAFAVLARVHLLRGSHARAAPLAREASLILERLGGVEEGEAFIRLVLAEVLVAIGDEDAARDAIRTARVRLLERAAMIQDPAWKSSFLDLVEENVRTFELASAWNAT